MPKTIINIAKNAIIAIAAMFAAAAIMLTLTAHAEEARPEDIAGDAMPVAAVTDLDDIPDGYDAASADIAYIMEIPGI